MPAPTARTKTVPAPLTGWNARDNLSDMAPTDAVSLINWYPRQSDIITRPGYAAHTSVGTSTVDTLIEFEYGTIHTMLAGTNGTIYDVTTDPAVQLATGFASNYWSADKISGKLLLANGADSVQIYDGSTCTTSGFTGVTLSSLNFVKTHNSRPYFVQKDTQSFWYGGVGAITGALTQFDMAATAGSLAGNLLVLAAITSAGNTAGPTSMLACIFASGDILVYEGSDPGSSTAFGLQGRYKIGRPLSKYAVMETENDVFVVTDRGYEQLSRVIQLGIQITQKSLLSDKIQQAVSGAIQSIGSSDTWRIQLFPAQQMLLFNVPGGSADTYSVQHVQNFNTAAWTKFSGLDIRSWCRFGSSFYVGTSAGKIRKFGTAMSDGGTAIAASCQQAWNYLGAPGIKKQVTMLRPQLTSSYVPPVSVALAKNFQAFGAPAVTTFSSSANAPAAWDTPVWDTVQWPSETKAWFKWIRRGVIGDAIGMFMSVSPSSVQITWASTTYMYQVGGLL